jgi:hypothetical protein
MAIGFVLSLQSIPAVRGKTDSPDAELGTILGKGSEYCRRLAGAALDFACRERIQKVVQELKESTIVLSVVTADGLTKGIGQPGRGRTEKNILINDYLLAKKGEKIEENRILLEHNGEAATGKEIPGETGRFYSFQPLFAPGELLGRDRQSAFSFKVIDEESFQGKKAWVVEARSKPEYWERIKRAKIWIEKKSGQVLKMEIEYAAVAEAYKFFEESASYDMKCQFTATHLFELEKNGVRFPTKTEFRIVYSQEYDPGFASAKEKKPTFSVQKMNSILTYDHYRFFTVKVEHEIKKNG